MMCEWNNSEVLDLPPDIDTSKEVRSVSIDCCIVPAIKALWESKIQTLGCCCGHGKEPPDVVIAAGYEQPEIEAIGVILRKADARQWNILQWKLTTVGRSRLKSWREQFDYTVSDKSHGKQDYG